MKHFYTILFCLLPFCLFAQNTTKRAKGRVQNTVQPAPVPVLVINDTTVTEGGNLVLTVTKVGVTSLTVSASYSTAAGTAGSSDYTPVSGSVSFAPTEYVKQITIATTNDSEDEVEQETMYVNLTSPVSATIGKGQGVGTIIDNDETLPPPDLPTITINDRTVNEAAGTASFTVTRTGDLSGASQVSYTTANNTAQSGSDFTTATGTINWASGEDVKTITVTILNDADDENSEIFLVNLSSPVNCTITDGQGVGTITDDDDTPPLPPPTLSIEDVTVSEGGGSAVFTIKKTGATNLSVSVIATTSAGTAGEQDYRQKTQTITVLSTEYTKTFSVEVLEDLIDETTELFYANLSGAVNATISDAQGIGTILDNDTTIVLPDPPAATCAYTINAADYGVSAANTSNYSQLNTVYRYIETLPRTATKCLVMPAGAVLRVGATLTYPQTDSLTIEMNGAEIVSTIPVTNYTLTASSNWAPFIVQRHAGTPLFTNQPVLQTIDSGSYTFRISQTNSIKIKAGDHIVISTSKVDPFSSRNRQGAYKTVASVNTTTGVVTVTTPFYHFGQLLTTQALTVWAYRPSKGWTIRNGKFSLYTGSLGTCLYLEHMEGLVMEDCVLDGKAVMQGELRGFTARTKDSYMGLSVGGFNNVIRRVESKNFWDYDRNFGYGIRVYGESATIKNNILRAAKHGISTGIPQLYSANVLIDSNYTDDAMIDAHDDTRYVTIQNNVVENIGAGAFAIGIYSRAYFSTIRKNICKRAPTVFPAGVSTSGVYVDGIAGGYQNKIDSNNFQGVTYGIHAAASNTISHGSLIRGNTFTGCSYALFMRRGHDITFSGNAITSPAWGVHVRGVRNSAFSGNNISYGASSYGGGIYLEAETSTTWTGNNILNNTIAAGNYGTSPIRVQNGYNSLTITGNTLTWPGSRFTLANSISISECLTCSILAVFGNTGSSININTFP